MGIPSYYKKLTDQLPTLVSRRHPEAAIAWLFMDFNCLIYHCLQQMPPYGGNDTKAEWEAVLIENVTRYALKVIHDVSPKSGVVIAIDGVVPMAKMRQQRLRRFKSVWMTAHPQEGDSVSTGPKWDTNAITPGTDFMKKLRVGLEKMISHKGRASWVLSSSDEPGEGEHKIMAEWRKGIYQGNYAVYGLDADLIVLSLLGQTLYGNRVWLFREEMDKGKMVYDSMGEEQFEWFSIEVLREWLSSGVQDTRAFLLNYCFAMSVLGNDFLPSSLGLKIREDGHAELLDHLRTSSLIDPATLMISDAGLLAFFQKLAISEKNRIEH